MVPTDRPALIPVLTTHVLGEVAAIAQALPDERIALQWDVCQEVIAWEGYYEPGPVDFRKETITELIAIGDGVPAAIELGYHLCYGSPADEHVIQPKDAGIMVEIVNAVSAGVRRPIQFFHLPVPQPPSDDAYFAPLAGLNLRPETELLSRPRSPRRHGRQRRSPRCRPAPCPGRRRGHRMRHGARRSRALPGAARSKPADRRTGRRRVAQEPSHPRLQMSIGGAPSAWAISKPTATPPRGNPRLRVVGRRSEERPLTARIRRRHTTAALSAVRAHRGPKVRIRSPPAESLQTIGSAVGDGSSSE
jgi:hypothetical protein